jgi:tRNA 2-thiouridine synthesizing protein A
MCEGECWEGSFVDVVADRVLDCTGQACPLPVINTARTIKTIEIGEVLELLATDPGVEPDMKAWSSRTKNTLLGIERDGAVFHVFLRRNR